MSNLLHSFYNKNPQATALIEVNGNKWNFGHIYQYSFQLEQFLIENGVKKNQKIMILVEPGFKFTCLILACFKLGATVVLIDPKVGPNVFKSQLKQADPEWIAVDSKLKILKYHPILRFLITRFKPEVGIITQVPASKILPSLPKFLKENNYNKSNIAKMESKEIPNETSAIVVFTSGTTGSPKGVVHSHTSLAASFKILKGIVSSDNHVLYATLPYFLLVGIGLGVPVVFNKNGFSARKFLKDSELYKPTITFGPPAEFISILNYLSKQKLNFPKSYKTLLFGSAIVSSGFLKKMHTVLPQETTVTCLYGMTEILPISTVDALEKLAYKGKGDLLGDLVPNTKAKIAENGELLISAKHQALNYLNQPKSKWIATGDKVSIIDNQLVLEGRFKDMILKGSFNIYPALYESTIEKIPGVMAACLIGVYDHKKEDEKVILVIETTPSTTLTANYLKKALRSGPFRINEKAQPDEIIFRVLPRFGRQKKIDKLSLRAELGKEM